MTDRGGSSADPSRPDPIGTTRYYLVIHEGFTREWPSGLMRRRVLDASGATDDEAWTARGRWERTMFFRAAVFGDFSNNDVERIEVDEAEADAARRMLGRRPRGGPFTEAGRRWIRQHPEPVNDAPS